MTETTARPGGHPPTTVHVDGAATSFDGDVLVVGVFAGGELSPAGAAVDHESGGILQSVIDTGDMKGEKDSQAILYTNGGLRASRVLLAGLGKREDVDAESLRRASANTARRLRELGARRVGTTLHSGVLRAGLGGEEAGTALVEGALMGLYRFSVYRTPDEEKPDTDIDTFVLLDADTSVREDLASGSRRGETLSKGANIARDLGNEPPNVLSPLKLAERAEAVAHEVGLTCRIIRGDELVKEGFGALLAVGAGSANPPAFIILEHEPERDEPPLVFVGKGICFDSGGISLKSGAGMMDMKLDMAGSAAVVGAMYAIGAMSVPRKVVGLIAAAENMPSATAQRPGDVIRALDGQTIEILNTDAEGRVVLADALAYAKRLDPVAAVDLATLTGACVTALGSRACGLFGRHDDDTNALVERIEASADAVHERVWRMPLWDEYDEQIKSDVADVKNIGGSGGAGAITGAAFLKKFAQGYPWVHLDIAGVMSYDADKNYAVKGASGFGVRLLAHLAENWAN